MLISAATSIAFIRWCLDKVDGAARLSAPSACRRMAIVYTRIADDECVALDGIRRTMGFILRGPHHAASNWPAAGSTRARCGTPIATSNGRGQKA